MPRHVIALLLVCVAAAWLLLGLNAARAWATFAAHEAALRAWARAETLPAAAVYVASYVALLALSLPLGGIMTMMGGLLFGPLLGAALALAGATGGATALFLLARGALAARLARKAGPRAAALREGLLRDGFSYLLALRLAPVVPFWLGNLAPALAGMRLAPFVAATVIGIVPTTLLLARLGAGLAGTLAAGARPAAAVMSPDVLLPLLGLAALSLAPMAWRRWRRAGL